MQFLTPLFWIGALGITIPIFLHLVRREKTKRIPFASLMFVRRLPVKELQRRRLDHLLLLFLRCLGLILIVCAFARPVATGMWLNQVNPLSARSVVILIDASLSMSREATWERALQSARDQIDSVTTSDEALIIQFGKSVEVLSQWENATARLHEILDNHVQPSFESTSYVEGLRMATEQLEDARNSSKEIHLITDLQQNGIMGAAGWRMPPNITVTVDNVGEKTVNLFVEEGRLEREVFTNKYPHSILIRVGGNPEQPIKGEAKLFVEGQLLDRQPFEIGSEGSANLTFKPFDLEVGISKGRVVIEPSDELAVDNLFHFVVEKQAPRRTTVFQNQSGESEFYLYNALSSGRNVPFVVGSETLPAPSQIDPEKTPLVILNDLQRPPRRSTFESYVQNGGGLILVLSKNALADAYNREWSSLLPARLIERNFVRGKNKSFTSITEVNWEHPIFAVFRDAHKAAIGSTQFFSYWRLEPASDASVLARFSEGDPALVERSIGKGKVLVFASSLDPIWTDFPLRSAYVPFWYRMAQYTAGWQPRPSTHQVSQVIPVESSSQETEGTSGSWNLIDPEGQRVLGLDERHPDFVQLKMPGHYEVRSQKRTDWIAVNTPPQESDLRGITLEEFQAVFVPVQSRVEEAGLAPSIQERDQLQSLWWIFLLTAAMVFWAESLVANRTQKRAN